MTRTTASQSSIDRETTVMSFSGQSPPHSPPPLPLHAVTCPRNHPIAEPHDYFLAPSGRAKTCRICRLAWTQEWLARQADPAVQAARAARKAQTAAERLARREERKAGIRLLMASRRTTRARRTGLPS